MALDNLTHQSSNHKRSKKSKKTSKITTLKKNKMKHKKTKEITSKIIVGWQEWCSLPKLHVPAIKVKIDTGAKTSALHAWDIHPFHRHGELFVHFILHPIQRNIRITQICSAKVIDERIIMNSGGQKEKRYIINTPIVLGDTTWNIEVSLTNRDALSFRMILGRDALKNYLIIDTAKKLCHGKLTTKEARTLYAHQGH